MIFCNDRELVPFTQCSACIAHTVCTKRAVVHYHRKRSGGSQKPCYNWQYRVLFLLCCTHYKNLTCNYLHVSLPKDHLELSTYLLLLILFFLLFMRLLPVYIYYIYNFLQIFTILWWCGTIFALYLCAGWLFMWLFHQSWGWLIDVIQILLYFFVCLFFFLELDVTNIY